MHGQTRLSPAEQSRGLNVSLGGQIWTMAGTGRHTHTGGRVIIITAADVQRRQPGGHWPCSSRGEKLQLSECQPPLVKVHNVHTAHKVSKCTMCTRKVSKCKMCKNKSLAAVHRQEQAECTIAHAANLHISTRFIKIQTCD